MLERKAASQIIDELHADQYVLDGKNIFKNLEKEGIHAENKADTKYLSVMAASIIAKNARDQSIDRYFKTFEDEYGTIRGGGYANEATIQFTCWHYARFASLPECLRKSYQYKKLYDVLEKKS